MSFIEYQSLLCWDEWQELHPVLPQTKAWAAAVIAFQVIGNLLLLSPGFAQFGNITSMTKCSCPCLWMQFQTKSFKTLHLHLPHPFASPQSFILYNYMSTG